MSHSIEGRIRHVRALLRVNDNECSRLMKSSDITRSVQARIFADGRTCESFQFGRHWIVHIYRTCRCTTNNQMAGWRHIQSVRVVTAPRTSGHLTTFQIHSPNRVIRTDINNRLWFGGRRAIKRAAADSAVNNPNRHHSLTARCDSLRLF